MSSGVDDLVARLHQGRIGKDGIRRAPDKVKREAAETLKAQAAEIATLRDELAGAREALATAERVMLWAERRMACKEYAQVIANDARNVHAHLAAIKEPRHD